MPCACKGIRYCKECHPEEITTHSIDFFACKECGSVLPNNISSHPCTPSPVWVLTNQDFLPISNAQEPPFSHPYDISVFLYKDFITKEEEEALIQETDLRPWTPSQSGRRKQDYGPQVNFKKQKISIAPFNGLPPYVEPIVRRLLSLPSQLVGSSLIKDSSSSKAETSLASSLLLSPLLSSPLPSSPLDSSPLPSSPLLCSPAASVLNGFDIVELCNLEYTPERASHIDFHFDDFWVWGERLVTVNLQGSTELVFRLPEGGKCLSVPMPERSLIVVKGDARYRYQHAVLSQDIDRRRLAMTFRELGKPFLSGGEHEEAGKTLIERGKTFEGTPRTLTPVT